MARFSDPDKWKDIWFRKLSGPSKLLWFYILDTCDNAGFYVHDEEVVCLFTGMKQAHVDGAIEGLARGLLGPNKNGVYWVRDFIKLQKNAPLNPSNNAHKQIIRLLKEKGVGFETDEYLAPNQPLIRGTGKGKGKGKGKGRVEYSREFEEFWTLYGIGGKKPAFEAWQTQNPSTEEVEQIMACVPVYKTFCKKADRTLKDGQGWVNQRFWETDWSKQPIPKSTEKPFTPQPEVRNCPTY